MSEARTVIHCVVQYDVRGNRTRAWEARTIHSPHRHTLLRIHRHTVRARLASSSPRPTIVIVLSQTCFSAASNANGTSSRSRLSGSRCHGAKGQTERDCLPRSSVATAGFERFPSLSPQIIRRCAASPPPPHGRERHAEKEVFGRPSLASQLMPRASSFR